jgi:hypothetical protein
MHTKGGKGPGASRSVRGPKVGVTAEHCVCGFAVACLPWGSHVLMECAHTHNTADAGKGVTGSKAECEQQQQIRCSGMPTRGSRVYTA